MTPTQEFVVQHNENANPPTFFLTLETLIDRMQEEDKMVGSVRRETATFSKLSCTLCVERQLHFPSSHVHCVERQLHFPSSHVHCV